MLVAVCRRALTELGANHEILAATAGTYFKYSLCLLYCLGGKNLFLAAPPRLVLSLVSFLEHAYLLSRKCPVVYFLIVPFLVISSRGVRKFLFTCFVTRYRVCF